MFRKAFDFFVFSNLFVALCAVAVVWQTYSLFSLLLFNTLAPFAFFGTLCSYSFHWYLTPKVESSYSKVQWAIAFKKLHGLLFLIGAAGSAFFLFQLRHYWFWMTGAVIITFLYSAPKLPFYPFIQLRKIAIAKTLFVALVWMYVTAFLPFVVSGVALTKVHYFFLANRFLFYYAICILFDFRDREQDKEQGIKGFITSSGERRIDAIFWSCVAAYFITCLLLYDCQFSGGVCMALLLPVVLLAFSYRPLKNNFSDYWYYFFLDGLLIFSALLQLLFQF